MGFEGADQGAVFSFGAEGGVDFEEAVGAEADEFAGDPGGCCVCWFGHEDDVDVGNVVEFPGAAFAHGDDGELGFDGVVAVDVSYGYGEGGGEGGVG